MSEAEGADKLLQTTCSEIVATVTKTVEAESSQQKTSLRLPNGPVVGNRIVIDATEKEEVVNICRLSLLNPDLAPEGEVVRIEYEHDKQTKFGMQRVYSIQSVRRKAGQLILLENFLAATARDVREEDFRPIQSDQYAQQTVLATLTEWARYRAWQIQEAHKSNTTT
jgi:O-phosphoseryl-tRNA(Cys) synthetase